MKSSQNAWNLLWKSSKHLFYVPLSCGGGRSSLWEGQNLQEEKEGFKSLKCSRFNSVPLNHLGCISLILADTKLRKTETRCCSQRFLYWSFKVALTHLKRGKTVMWGKHQQTATSKWEVSKHSGLWWLHGNSDWQTQHTLKINSFLH